MIEYDTGDIAELPISKDLLYMNGDVYELEGIVVYAPQDGEVFIPQQAVELMGN
jgi:hypothetical protein